MSTFLLYHRRSRPTGHVIADALGVQHGYDLLGGVRPESMIRWGSQAEVSRVNRIVNHSRAIATASNKLESLRLLSDAGVNVPMWSTNPTDLDFPYMGRRTHHARGTDIVLCLQKSDYERQPRDYYIEYIPTVREFRVHVAFGKVIRVQGKFLDRPELAVPWIRNYANGYRFRAPRKKLMSERLNMATLAVETLGLDFGAVDLLISDENKTYVLEVNTAPACSPLTAAAYVTAFQAALEIPDEQVALSRLDILSREQEDGDTEDEVEGGED